MDRKRVEGSKAKARRRQRKIGDGTN